jgi:hypothetical protein
MFIKPLAAKMSIELCQELVQMKVKFQGEVSNTECIKHYSGHKSLKAIVNLVVTSLSQISESDLRQNHHNSSSFMSQTSTQYKRSVKKAQKVQQ